MGINFICVFDCFVLKIERRDDGVGVNEIGRGGWRRMEYFFYDFDKNRTSMIYSRKRREYGAFESD